MSLYLGFRDISMFRHMNRELISGIVAEEVVYYKISIAETTTNSYGETNPSTGRFYNPGILLNCLREVQNQTTIDSEPGPDQAQVIQYRFLRDDLIDIQLVPERGDIIMWKNEYFEADNVIENQILGGKYPEYALSDATSQFGSSWSILVDTHHTRPTKLNITQDRL
jgi:hypothetical protein